MFIIRCCIAAVFLMIPGDSYAQTAHQQFWDFWGDGKAEISSYSLKQSRYGGTVNGHAVLIFVTEDISDKTRIKLDGVANPPKDKLPVLKLNRIHKFITGIYDYSIMTSTFAAVDARFGYHPLQAMKVSFTAQEWCGHISATARLDPALLRVEVNSYFEKEGDQDYTFKAGHNLELEDNLPIVIRELKGEVLAVGTSKEIDILPSFWYNRGRGGLSLQRAILRKTATDVTINDDTSPAFLWTWTIGERTEQMWVDTAYPHRILQWESSTGQKGTLLHSERLSYWKTNRPEHLSMRDDFQIPRW